MAKATENYETIVNIQDSLSSLWSDCHSDIQRRINALLNYQAEYFQLCVEFYRQLQSLQYEYSAQFEQISAKQRAIIDGSMEPKASDTELVQPTTQKSKQVSSQEISNSPRNESHLAKQGVENFWLIVLKNIDSYDYPIQPRDELCLKYLIDIRCVLSPPSFESTSFTLEFHFLPANPFFNQTILTKQYFIRFQSNDSKPYESYDGPEIDRCHGCTIRWNPDHNLTVRKRIKRIRNKTTGEIRLEEAEESAKSFFEFFSPPIIPDNGINEMDNDDQIRLEADIEFGLLLKQRVLPRAVLYYTNEALSVFDNIDYNDDDDHGELTSSDSFQ